MVGIDIFTGKKHEDICPSTHNMSVPNVKRVEYSVRTKLLIIDQLFFVVLFKVVDIDNDGYVSMMDDSSEVRSDVKLPEGDLGAEIRAKFDSGEGLKVTVLQALTEEAIMSYKIEQESKR